MAKTLDDYRRENPGMAEWSDKDVLDTAYNVYALPDESYFSFAQSVNANHVLNVPDTDDETEKRFRMEGREPPNGYKAYKQRIKTVPNKMSDIEKGEVPPEANLDNIPHNKKTEHYDKMILDNVDARLADQGLDPESEQWTLARQAELSKTALTLGKWVPKRAHYIKSIVSEKDPIKRKELIKQYNAEKNALPEELQLHGIWEHTMYHSLQLAPYMLETTKQSVKRGLEGTMYGAGVGGAATAATGGAAIPAAAAATGTGWAVGSAIGAGEKAYEIEKYNMLGDLLEATDNEGNPIPLEVAIPIAEAVGIFNAGLEAVKLKYAFKVLGLDSLMKRVISTGAKKAIASPTVRRLLLNKLVDWGKYQVVQIGQEELQEVANIVGEELGKELSTNDPSLDGVRKSLGQEVEITTPEGPKKMTQGELYLDQLLQTGVAISSATWWHPIPMSVRSTVRDTRIIRKAQKMNSMLDKLAKMDDQDAAFDEATNMDTEIEHDLEEEVNRLNDLYGVKEDEAPIDEEVPVGEPPPEELVTDQEVVEDIIEEVRTNEAKKSGKEQIAEDIVDAQSDLIGRKSDGKGFSSKGAATSALKRTNNLDVSSHDVVQDDAGKWWIKPKEVSMPEGASADSLDQWRNRVKKWRRKNQHVAEQEKDQEQKEVDPITGKEMTANELRAEMAKEGWKAGKDGLAVLDTEDVQIEFSQRRNYTDKQILEFMGQAREFDALIKDGVKLGMTEEGAINQIDPRTSQFQRGAEVELTGEEAGLVDTKQEIELKRTAARRDSDIQLIDETALLQYGSTVEELRDAWKSISKMYNKAKAEGDKAKQKYFLGELALVKKIGQLAVLGRKIKNGEWKYQWLYDKVKEQSNSLAVVMTRPGQSEILNSHAPDLNEDTTWRGVAARYSGNRHIIFINPFAQIHDSSREQTEGTLVHELVHTLVNIGIETGRIKEGSLKRAVKTWWESLRDEDIKTLRDMHARYKNWRNPREHQLREALDYMFRSAKAGDWHELYAITFSVPVLQHELAKFRTPKSKRFGAPAESAWVRLVRGVAQLLRDFWHTWSGKDFNNALDDLVAVMNIHAGEFSSGLLEVQAREGGYLENVAFQFQKKTPDVIRRRGGREVRITNESLTSEEEWRSIMESAREGDVEFIEQKEPPILDELQELKEPAVRENKKAELETEAANINSNWQERFRKALAKSPPGRKKQSVETRFENKREARKERTNKRRENKGLEPQPVRQRRHPSAGLEFMTAKQLMQEWSNLSAELSAAELKGYKEEGYYEWRRARIDIVKALLKNKEIPRTRGPKEYVPAAEGKTESRSSEIGKKIIEYRMAKHELSQLRNDRRFTKRIKELEEQIDSLETFLRENGQEDEITHKTKTIKPERVEAPTPEKAAAVDARAKASRLGDKIKDVFNALTDKYNKNQVISQSQFDKTVELFRKGHTEGVLSDDDLEVAMGVLEGVRPPTLHRQRADAGRLNSREVADYLEEYIEQVAPGHGWTYEAFYPADPAIAGTGYSLRASNPDSPIFGTSILFPNIADPGAVRTTIDERIALFNKFRDKPKGISYQKITDDHAKSPDPKIEELRQKYSGGIRSGFRQGFKDVISLIWDMRREFSGIKWKERGFYAEATKTIRHLIKQRGVAAMKAVNELTNILDGLSRSEYDVLSSFAYYMDLWEQVQMNQDLEKKLPLPNNLTEEQVINEARRLYRIVYGNKKLKTAWIKRLEAWHNIREDYIYEMENAGYPVRDKFKRQFYFRHQVIDYMTMVSNMAQVKGAPQGKLALPTKRSHLQARKGTTAPINMNMIQADFEVLTQLIYDTEIAKALNHIMDIYGSNKHLPGYIEYRPVRGNVLFLADTLPGWMVEQLTTGKLKELGVKESHLRKVLAIGGKYEGWFIPEKLNDIIAQAESNRPRTPLGRTLYKLQNLWKQWQLLNPSRWSKYNLRNLSGDAEAVFVGNPRVFAKVPRALYEVLMWKANRPSELMKLWLELGGEETLLQSQEISKIVHHPDFRKYNKGIHRLPNVNPIRIWMKFARSTTDMREAMLRFAAFIHYRERLSKGKSINYGGSFKEEVDNLIHIDDKAFMLSNDLLGAYDRISQIGTFLKQFVWPFWSFQEINMDRTAMFFRNAAKDDRLTGAIGMRIAGKGLGLAIKSPIALMNIGKIVLALVAMSTLMTMWNNWKFPEEELALPEEMRRRSHVIIGSDGDDVIYFPRIGILGDLLEWIGMDTGVVDIMDVVEGRRKLKDVIADYTQWDNEDIMTAFRENTITNTIANKVFQGLGPQYKIPFEMVTGIRLFPDIFNPSFVGDPWQHAADQLSVKEYVQAIQDAPMPKDWKQDKIWNSIVYKKDIKRMAYINMLDKKERFLKENGLKGTGFIRSENSNLLYEMALSWRYGDKVAFARAYGKYIEACIKKNQTPQTTKDIWAKIHPLYGVPKKWQGRWLGSLEPQDQYVMKLSWEYYAEMVSGKQFIESE